MKPVSSCLFVVVACAVSVLVVLRLSSRTKSPIAPLPVGGYVKLQADIQRGLKPAMWIPILRYPHNWWETWTVENAEPEVSIKDIGRAIEKIVDSAGAPEGVGGGQMLFHLASLRYSAEERTGYATMLCFTKARWMDIVELQVYKPKEGGAGSEVRAHGYSTGLFPLKIPLAPLLSIPLCFVPFSDKGIIGTSWMPGIRNRLEHKATVNPDSAGRAI